MRVACLLVGLLLCCGIARAQPVAGNRAAALSIESLGYHALDEGNYLKALDCFQRAFRVYPAPAQHYNIGRALQQLGRDPEAIDQFATFVGEAKDAPRERIADAKARIASLVHRVERVVVDSTVPGAAVFVDDEAVGLTPLGHPLYLAPGNHVVAVKKGNYLPFTWRTKSLAGLVKRVAVELKPAEAAPIPAHAAEVASSEAPAPKTNAPDPAEQAKRRAIEEERPPGLSGAPVVVESAPKAPVPSRVLPLVVGGVALAALGAGLGLGVSVFTSCAADHSCATAADVDSVKLQNGLSVGLLAAAAVALAVDVVLWVKYRRATRLAVAR